MHRLFVPGDAVQGDWVRLTGSAARQLSRVLGLRPGDRFRAVDPTGAEWVVGRQDPAAEPGLRVHLVQAIPRGDRSVVRPDPAAAARRVRRWSAIAREAAELCGRSRVPEVAAVRPL